jgi:DNA-binding transcriptional ArsR family regulator
MFGFGGPEPGEVMATTKRRPRAAARAKIASDLRSILTGPLFAALCEPARVAILEFLTANGRSDIATIAEQFPQDRSVISRHLAALGAAGLVRREKAGRNVFFEVDGVAAVDQLEAILERFRKLVPLCCPPKSRARAGGVS